MVSIDFIQPTKENSNEFVNKQSREKASNYYKLYFWVVNDI